MQLVFEANYGVYQVTVPYSNGSVNFFIVVRPEGLTLIDTGPDTDEAWGTFLRSLDSIGRTIRDLRRVMITHHHHDHVGLLRRIVSCGKIPVYAHPLAIPRLMRDPGFLSSRIDFFGDLYRQMGCQEAGEQYIARLKQTIPPSGGAKVDMDITPISEGAFLDGFEILDVPGHAPDHLMFYDRENRLLFSGDHLLPKISSNAIVEPDPAGHRMATLVMYRRSLDKFGNLQVELGLPGHGKPFKHYAELTRRRLSYIEDKVNRLETLLTGKRLTPFELAREYYPTKYISQFSLVMSSIIGSLDLLEREGRVKKDWAEGMWHYTKANEDRIAALTSRSPFTSK